MDGLQSSYSSEEAHDFHADIAASWMVRSGLRSSATWPASELRLACYSLPSLGGAQASGQAHPGVPLRRTASRQVSANRWNFGFNSLP